MKLRLIAITGYFMGSVLLMSTAVSAKDLSGYYAEISLGANELVSTQGANRSDTDTNINYNFSDLGGDASGFALSGVAGYRAKINIGASKNWEIGTNVYYYHPFNLKESSNMQAHDFGLELTAVTANHIKSLQGLDLSFGRYVDQQKMLVFLQVGPTWSNFSAMSEYMVGTTTNPDGRKHLVSEDYNWQIGAHAELGLNYSLTQHQFVGLNADYFYIAKTNVPMKLSTPTEHADDYVYPKVFSISINYGLTFG